MENGRIEPLPIETRFARKNLMEPRVLRLTYDSLRGIYWNLLSPDSNIICSEEFNGNSCPRIEIQRHNDMFQI